MQRFNTLLTHTSRMYSTSRNIVLYDGVCNLCNSSVRFVIRWDKGNIFKFASMQSAVRFPQFSYPNR